MPRSRVIAEGMLRQYTPIENHLPYYGLWVKREDMSCLPPGPPFSKTRGVYARVKSRDERIIGVLDTFHSQAGHAVARACQILGKKCVNYYPLYKHDWELRKPQKRAQELGADLVGIPAGRSCILFHRARKEVEMRGGYMMPNALKLEESVEETAKEAREVDTNFQVVIIPASSATLAAGVLRGFLQSGRADGIRFIIHLGYSRSIDAVRRYLAEKTDEKTAARVELIDEGYSYRDKAKPGQTPPWPCNEYYDLKAFRWYLANRESVRGRTLFWNIG